MEKIYFGKTSKGFFLSNPPENEESVEVTPEKHKEILSEHYSSGKHISSDDAGNPILIDVVQSVSKEDVIMQRNALLSESDWTILPDAPFTKAQKDEWRVYRQALRDITEQKGFPENVVFPEAPVFKKTTE